MCSNTFQQRVTGAAGLPEMDPGGLFESPCRLPPSELLSLPKLGSVPNQRRGEEAALAFTGVLVPESDSLHKEAADKSCV